jgi:AraC-like DNA-binding protein
MSLLSNGGEFCPPRSAYFGSKSCYYTCFIPIRRRFHSIQIITRDKQQLQIKKVVESQIGQPTTVDDLAFLCHMSTSTFKRKFNEIYQTSPQKWLLARRLELAADYAEILR